MMIPPLVYIVLMVIVIVVTSLQPYGKAKTVEDYESLCEQLKSGNEVELTVSNVAYLGYKEQLLGKTIAYYYIGEFEDKHIIFTISQSEYDKMKESAESYTLKATVRIHTGRLSRVELAVIDDLGWTEEGMRDQVVQVLFEDVEVMHKIAVVIFWFLMITIIIAVFGMLMQSRYLKQPEKSPYYKKHMKEC
ncbi:hypothetical protein [Eubacterium oxidoreducens]|nr:hypothetical protein [Eubacterium oxidoreducens]